MHQIFSSLDEQKSILLTIRDFPNRNDLSIYKHTLSSNKQVTPTSINCITLE